MSKKRSFKNETACLVPGCLAELLLVRYRIKRLNERIKDLNGLWSIGIEPNGGKTYLDPRILPPDGMKACGHIVVNEVRLEEQGGDGR